MDLTTFLVIVLLVETLIIIYLLYEYFHLPSLHEVEFHEEEDHNKTIVIVTPPAAQTQPNITSNPPWLSPPRAPKRKRGRSVQRTLNVY